jgi:hypothetical protein
LTLPDDTFRALGASIENALYPDRWSVVVEESRLYQHTGGTTVPGFDNLEVGTKVAICRSERHEFVLTPALFITTPTASRKLGTRSTALKPTVLLANGFGDLKWNWIRPLAVQGDLGYETSITGERERQVIYDMVLLYSVPYLNRFIRHINAGFDLEHNLRLGHSPRAILGDMFPFIEFNGSTPVAGTSGSTSTFARPGALYMGKYFQIGAAMDLPLRWTSPRQRVGAVLLLDLYLDEIHSTFGWAPFGKHHHQEEDPKD